LKGIIAINNLGYIGKDNKLMWKSSEDLQHFKRLTEGSRCLVGYNTNLELPPLTNRTIIVDTKDGIIEADRQNIDWCIGGKKTYEKYVKFFTEIHISHIDNNDIGDTMLPMLLLDPDCKIFNYYFKTNK
jgi:dihydrofolate reductase|tara:strand:- start:836 stop:1222 length:387 start_codon:yes stop_codon:yes gene_type:complete